VILVVDYDPSWPQRFEQLQDELSEALTSRGVPFVGIEHVGSTSVPGLAGKPVIDCDIIVGAKDVPAGSRVLIALGFTPLGELGIPQRWAFKEPDRLPNTNVYVIVGGSLSLRNHLALRDALRADSTLREKYAEVKRRVASTARNIDEYVAGKNEMIQEILAAAGLTEQERRSINVNQLPSHLSGFVEAGRGLGGVRPGGEPVLARVRDRSGFRVVPGTLNVRLAAPFDPRLATSYLPSSEIDPEWERATGRAGYRFMQVTVEGRYRGLAFQADEPGYPPDLLEIMCEVNLRSTLRLTDGDLIAFNIED
jgi:GrpB-like predicted nucleotidyltransferase (UPF0157 family)